MMRLWQILTLLCFVASCGRESTSQTASTYGDLDWRYTDQISDLPPHAKAIVQASVILSSATYAPSEYGFCSGTLVHYEGLDAMLSAGHCIENQAECDETYIIPNYQFGEDGKLPSEYTVLKCDKLLFARLRGQKRDIAVATYKVIKKPKNPKIAKVALKFGAVEANDPLVIASHPSSVDRRDVLDILDNPNATDEDIDYIQSSYAKSKQVSVNCKVTHVEPYQLNHNCDTRGGSSGAGIFSMKTGRFIGLHYLGGYNNYWYETPDPDQYNTAMHANFVHRVFKRLTRQKRNRKG